MSRFIDAIIAGLIVGLIGYAVCDHQHREPTVPHTATAEVRLP